MKALTCEDVVSGEIAEKYLVDELSNDTRDSFEQHYFECGRCFALLQTYRAVQAELAHTRAASDVAPSRPSWVWRWAWAPAVAVLFIAVGVAFWPRPFSEPVGSPTDKPTPSGPIVESGTPAPPALISPDKLSFDDLARFEPPRFEQGRLRGADAATARFLEAMEQYQRRNYAAAIPGLRAALELEPEAPHVAFFLGISQLLTAQPELAIDHLNRTIAFGDSPYLEEAHFYLAKAYLQMQKRDEAIKELERTVQLRGEREADARQLLAQIATLTDPTK